MQYFEDLHVVNMFDNLAHNSYKNIRYVGVMEICIAIMLDILS